MTIVMNDNKITLGQVDITFKKEEKKVWVRAHKNNLFILINNGISFDLQEGSLVIIFDKETFEKVILACWQ